MNERQEKIYLERIYPKTIFSKLPPKESAFTLDNMNDLWNLFKMIPDNATIMECGNYKGRTICGMSPIIKSKNLKVICYDNDYFNVRESFKDNISKFGLTEHVTLITDDLRNMECLLSKNSVDLIYWDAPIDLFADLIPLFKNILRTNDSIICADLRNHLDQTDVFDCLNQYFLLPKNVVFYTKRNNIK